VGNTKKPGEDVNLLFMFNIQELGVNRLDFNKHVYCHNIVIPLLLLVPIVNGTKVPSAARLLLSQEGHGVVVAIA
jgi:hypothetical protein